MYIHTHTHNYLYKQQDASRPINRCLPVALLEAADDLVRDPLALDGAQERAGVQPVVMHVGDTRHMSIGVMPFDRNTFDTSKYITSIYIKCVTHTPIYKPPACIKCVTHTHIINTPPAYLKLCVRRTGRTSWRRCAAGSESTGSAPQRPRSRGPLRPRRRCLRRDAIVCVFVCIICKCVCVIKRACTREPPQMSTCYDKTNIYKLTSASVHRWYGSTFGHATDGSKSPPPPAAPPAAAAAGGESDGCVCSCGGGGGGGGESSRRRMRARRSACMARVGSGSVEEEEAAGACR